SKAERTRDEKSRDAGTEVRALRAISRLRGPIPVDLLPRLVELDGTFGGSRLLELVLLESGDPTQIDFVRRRHSDADIELARSLPTLRPVPREYLPRKSQFFIEDS
ncbi:MAG: hypothetical protein SGJ09_12225, partial [Phycisphaerae bacterium]|nr:hypothetical protein [Phycisphaerae bacterium]